MNVWDHAIVNFIFGALLRYEPIAILVFVLGAVLIDIDHPLYMIFVERIYSPSKMWKWHKREFKKMGRHRFIFHQVEVLIVLAVLGYFINQYMFLFFTGAIIHWVIDMIAHIEYYGNLGSLGYYSILARAVKK